jgi:hypothetical protein
VTAETFDKDEYIVCPHVLFNYLIMIANNPSPNNFDCHCHIMTTWPISGTRLRRLLTYAFCLLTANALEGNLGEIAPTSSTLHDTSPSPFWTLTFLIEQPACGTSDTMVKMGTRQLLLHVSFSVLPRASREHPRQSS